MINMSHDMRINVNAITFSHSMLKEEKHSMFHSYTVLAATENHVHLAYMRIKLEEPTADHIMIAY